MQRLLPNRPALRNGLLALTVLVLATGVWVGRDIPGDAWTYWTGKRPLAGVKSWHYQLDKVDIDALSRRNVDMIVTDYAREGGKIPLTREQVARLKAKPDGSRRIAISYLSIGEAEEFRFYWDENWKSAKPAWLERENCAWPRAWMVRFWDPGWRDLIVTGQQSYLKRIIDAGFDGVYLDRVDMWEHTAKLNREARSAMIDLVRTLAAEARKLKPDFIVISQNAEDLLDDRSYRRTIDAVAKEELFYSKSATGSHNNAEDIASALGNLSFMRWQWKPVFPVEYLQDAAAIAAADSEVRARGLVPVFPPRALDGTEPTAPVVLDKEVGTPEFIKDKCPAGTAW